MNKVIFAVLALAAGSVMAEEIVLPTVNVTGSLGSSSTGGSGFGVLNLNVVPAGSVIKYGSANIDKEPSQPLSWQPRFPSNPPGTPLQVVGSAAAVAGMAIPGPAGKAISAGGVVANLAGGIVNGAPSQPTGTFPKLAKMGESRN